MATSNSTAASLLAENAALKIKAKKLEESVASMESQLIQSRLSKIKISIGKPRKLSKASDTFCRVIIPDSHGCFIDEQAASALIADIKVLNPSSIIMLGDHIDCGGFLAEHHTLGFVAEADYSFEDDCNATNQFLDEIQRAAPKARIEYLEGNHERRIEKWIVTQTRRHQKDAAHLHARYSTSAVLFLEKRSIDFWSQGKFHEGLSIPATIRRNGCYFTHGEFTSKNAAAAHLAKYNANIWYGHTHRADFAMKRTVKDGSIGAWNPGVLCRLQPLWMMTNLTDWTHGYGIQVVRKGFGHLNMQIPIIDGISYLSPLLEFGAKR
jgi:predicted phosphodiesterase